MEQYVPFLPDDLIIFLGDYVDRGLDTRGVIDWLIDCCRTLDPVLLRGNHEIMMLAARDDYYALRSWKNCGGEAALMSYNSQEAEPTLDDVPVEHWQFLETALLPHYETATHMFAHASLTPHRSLEDQTDDVLYWTSLDDWFVPHQSGKTLVCGHTSQKNGLPKVVPGCVCVDTWACGDGWLTCLDVHSGEYWQTNERRERRQSKLAMPVQSPQL